MNNDRNNLDLEGLLAEVEHAGRDARRQEELGAMIDSMAGTRSHGFWWWTVRVAAAACLLFFISTAVRIWFLPTDSGMGENMVAENRSVVAEPQTSSSLLATLGATSSNLEEAQNGSAHNILNSSTKTGEGSRREAVVEEYDMEGPVVTEEYYAEEVDTTTYSSPLATLGSPSSNLEEELVIVADNMPDSSTDSGEKQDGLESIAAPVVSVCEPAATTAEERKPKRVNILSRIFCRDDISKMDGTVLAFSIF